MCSWLAKNQRGDYITLLSKTLKWMMIAVLKWLMRIRIEFVVSVVETMAWQYLSSHVMWTNSMRDR